jgi:hypothetical protein
MQIKALIKTHKLAIILAVMVGLVSVAPQLYILRDKNYQGIQMFGTDAEYFYVGRFNQALDENYSHGPFPNDPGKDYYLAPKLGERIIALFAKIFNTRVIEINVALKFIGPILLFLILYGWILEMFSWKTVALIAPLFVIFGINLLNPADLLRLGLLKTSVDSFLPYTRPISPLLSSLFLFSGLWGIYRSVSNKLSLKISAALGILISLSLYVYIFTWTFLVVVLGLYFLYFLVKKEWQKAKYFFTTLGLNGIVVLPYFLNLLRARADQDYLYMAAREGLIHTRAPILGGWVVAGFLALIFLWPSAYRNVKYFFLFLFGALVVVLNQQVITGSEIQAGHYHWFTTKPLIAIMLGFLILYLAGKIVSNHKFKIAVPVLLVAGLFFNGIIIQAHSYSANYQTYQKNQRYASMLAFINDTYGKKNNIFTNTDLSFLILAYTHHAALMASDSYIESQVHRQDILFLEYRLKGTLSKSIMGVIFRDREYVTSTLFGVYYRDMPGNSPLSDGDLEKLALAYGVFYKIPLDQVFKNLNIDLVIVDDGIDSGYFDKLAFLARVYSKNNLFVYQVKPK